MSDLLENDYITEADCEEFCQMNKYAQGIFAEKKSYVYKQMFLLKSEAENHLKNNRHHYSGEAFVFCNHAWRSPVQEKAFNDMKALKRHLERTKRLEEALKFYADHNENWRKDIKTGQSNIVNDQGLKAQQALGKED